MERELQVVFIDMEHDWKRATLKPEVATKNSDSTNLTRYFQGGGGGHILLRAELHHKTICLVFFFTWNDNINMINNSAENIWIFAVDNSIMLIWLKNNTQNIQKYMQIWRIQMSPLGGGAVKIFQVMWPPIFAPQCQRLVNPKDTICDI